jgi:aromatic-L-amino-acid decarboxylase
LKLWFVMRHYGAAGLRAHIRKHVALARELAAWIADDSRLALAAPTPLNLVCFKHRAGDEATQRLLDAINDSGKAYCTHARLNERLVIRVAIGGVWTERRHIEALWTLIKDKAE